MKAVLGVLLFNLVFFVAQAQRVCGTTDYTQRTIDTDPSLKNSYRTAEDQIDAVTKSNISVVARDVTADEIIYIPVVIHIVYKTADVNLSTSQVLSQLTVLNNDYGYLNADKINTPAVFAKLAADTKIRFCLAQVDPQGRRTTGIIRKHTNTDAFSAQDAVKYSSQGGDDAWDSKRYLNIWVCKMFGRTLGYSSVPGGAAAVDGVVIAYDVFGTEGNVRSPFNKGRTATHEIGHWLGLKHIWGDAICGSDDVDDTPTQQYYNYGSPSFPYVTNCSPDANGAMFMNFMDFTDDACMNIFTNGQKLRMRALFATGNLRNSFLTSFAYDSTLAQGGPLASPDTAIVAAPIVNAPVVVKESFTVKTYPNPAQSLVNIECANGTDAGTKIITIFNLMGRKVFCGQMGKQKITVDISNFSKGMYILQIEDGVNRLSKKIIKE
jgi:hypothetical protein